MTFLNANQIHLVTYYLWLFIAKLLIHKWNISFIIFFELLIMYKTLIVSNMKTIFLMQPSLSEGSEKKSQRKLVECNLYSKFIMHVGGSKWLLRWYGGGGEVAILWNNACLKCIKMTLQNSLKLARFERNKQHLTYFYKLWRMRSMILKTEDAVWLWSRWSRLPM